jgi:hypothetical protein
MGGGGAKDRTIIGPVHNNKKQTAVITVNCITKKIHSRRVRKAGQQKYFIVHKIYTKIVYFHTQSNQENVNNTVHILHMY